MFSLTSPMTDRKAATTSPICNSPLPGVIHVYSYGGEHAEEVVVFVDRLSVVPPLLLVPPVGVRVAELPLDARRVDVAAVLVMARAAR